MSRAGIVKKLKKKKPELNKSELETIIDVFVKSVTDALKEDKVIQIRNFGNFYTKKLKENFNARNPSTNELIYKPERVKVRFKPSKYLKKLINK